MHLRTAEGEGDFRLSLAALIAGWFFCFGSILGGLQVVSGVVAYRSRKQRLLGVATDNDERRLYEIKAIIASMVCGALLVVTGDGFVAWVVFVAVWILRAYRYEF